MDGFHLTLCEAKVKIQLPELNIMAHNLTKFQITDQNVITKGKEGQA